MIKQLKAIIFLCFCLPFITNAQEVKENYTLKATETGTKNYVARDYILLQAGFTYKPSSGESLKLQIDQCLLFPPTGATYKTESGNITTDSSMGGVVGTIPGQFNVSPSGAATYSIPIECPAGINGMTPQVSLNYNSQSGNGIAGWGWSIGGLSMISRGVKNIYFDTYLGDFDWGNQAPFYIDGMRLFEENRWGNDSVEYKPENEMYSRIMGYNILSYGPRTFRVYTKDGKVLEYGKEFSCFALWAGQGMPLNLGLLNGKNYGWGINKVTDNNGNTINYEYIAEWGGNGSQWGANNHRINRITFGSNIKQQNSNLLEMKFVYENRVAKISKFLGGKEVSQTKRIKSVQVKSSDKVIKTYSLEYETGKEYDHLSSVGLITATGEKLNPISITWTKESIVHHLGNEHSFSTISLLEEYFNDGYKIGGFDKSIVGDFNGDGLTDIVVKTYLTKGGKKPQFFVFYENSNGYFIARYAERIDNTRGRTCFLLDKDGDGQDEIFIFERGSINNDGTTKAPRNTDITPYLACLRKFSYRNNSVAKVDEKYFASQVQTIIPLDLYGDKEIDFALFDKDKTFIGINDNLGAQSISSESTSSGSGASRPNPNSEKYSLSQFGGYKNGQIFLTNINGVRGNEIMYVGKDKTEFYEYCYTDESILVQRKYAEIQDINYKDKIYIGDFNGDGLSDILKCRDDADNLEMFYSLGDGHFKKVTLPKDISDYIDNSNYNTVLTDLNEDGKTDIISAPPYFNGSISTSNAKLNVLLANGESFKLVKSEIVSMSDVSLLSNIGYFSNVSKKEISMNKYGSKLTTLSFDDSWQGVSTISNSLNNMLKFSYSDLQISNYRGITSSSVSSDEGFAESMVVSTKVNFRVIANISGNNINSSYTFKEPQVHKHGKGFIGFLSQFVVNYITGIEIESKSKLDETYYTMLPDKTTTRVKSGGAILNTTTQDVVLSSLGGKRYKTILNWQKEENKLTNTSVLKTYSDYDSYGNPANILTEYLNGTTKIDQSNSKNISYVSNGSWCPNKPKSVTVTKTLGSKSYARIESYVYDNKGNITSTTIDPDDENELITNYKNYNDFGNPQLIETSWNGKKRSSTITYSSSGRFVTSKTNKAIGFKTTYSYNEVTGLLDSEKDHLGLVTKYEYDAFGRQTKATFPDGTYAIKAIQWCKDSNLPNAVYYSYEEASGTSPIWTYYDNLGREIRKESYGFKKDKKIIVETEYNTKGQVWMVTEPYKSGEASSDKQTYTYDDYGRIKTIVATAGTTTYDYDGLTTKTTTPNGLKIEVKNAAGQLVSSSVNGSSVAFTYWPSGLTKTATPKGGVAVETTFDLQGNRISLVDPDAGTVTSEYNGFGELAWQEYTKKDEEGNLKTIRTESLYDTAGRNYKTIINGVPTETKFSTSTGFVDWVKKENGHEVEYKYDGLGRVTTLTEKVGGKSFPFKTTYDAFGREKTRTYPSGYSVSNYYTATSHLEQVKDPSGNNIWKGEKVNAKGQFKQCLKGSKTISYGYDDRGLPQTIQSNGIIDQFYQFKDDGNLEYRQDGLSDYKESFTYTTNKQLEAWKIQRGGSTVANCSMEYDGQGNIISKSDLDNLTMTYGENNYGPHAITSISGNPALIANDEQTITYTDFKKIATIKEGSKSLALTYGIDEQRRVGVFNPGKADELTRYYLGDYEENHSNGNVKKIHYIAGGNGLASIYMEENGVGTLYHTYTDYLGSLTALTDKDGNVVERYAFDPWGNRRNPSKWEEKDSRTSWLTNRGYTMHEHLDGFALINMNGRVYDPVLGRFLSPDPQLQAPGNWLNYNRYTYCWNNPLSYTDPDGEWVHIVIGAAVGGVINLAMNWDNVDNFWEGAAAFGVGAGAGALTAATGGAAGGTFMASTGAALGAAAIGGAATGATNNIIGQTGNGVGLNDVNWGQVGLSSAIGGVAGLASYGAGTWASNNLANPVIRSMRINSPMLAQGVNGMIGGAVGGAAGGFTGGFLFSGGDLNAGFEGAWSGFKFGGAIGAGVGLGSGYAYARKNDLNIWNGEQKFRTEPTGIQESLALDAAKNGAGSEIMQGKINDPYFKNHQKMQYVVKSETGQNVIIHYWRDPVTGALTNFKFKNAPVYNIFGN